MILRRITEHVKAQNWTAIALDFVIVVVGVFIGIQVSNWNDNRATNARAAIFSERLAEDLREEAWGYEYLIEYYKDVLAGAERAIAALEGDTTVSNEQFVIAAYRATQLKWTIRQRATYDELVSMGEIGLIRDEQLRSTAVRLFTTPLFDAIADQGRASEYRRLFRRDTPADVQRALLQACGDGPVTLGDYDSVKGSLSYDCALGMPPERIAAAAEALRADPDLAPALRLRFADIETALTEFQVVNSALRADLQEVARSEQ